MYDLFSKIWGIKIPELKTGDTFTIRENEVSKTFNQYDSSYSPFGIINSVKNCFTHVHNCREIMGGYIERLAIANKRHSILIGFRAKDVDFKLIVEYFNLINSKMGEDKAIKVYVSNFKNLLVIDAPDFWFKNYYRHAMLTLLIRLGCVYYKGDFDKAIGDYLLASKVKNVIKMFLDGWVNEKSPLINDNWGLVANYKELDLKTLETKLAKDA